MIRFVAFDHTKELLWLKDITAIATRTNIITSNISNNKNKKEKEIRTTKWKNKNLRNEQTIKERKIKTQSLLKENNLKKSEIQNNMCKLQTPWGDFWYLNFKSTNGAVGRLAREMRNWGKSSKCETVFHKSMGVFYNNKIHKASLTFTPLSTIHRVAFWLGRYFLKDCFFLSFPNQSWCSLLYVSFLSVSIFRLFCVFNFDSFHYAYGSYSHVAQTFPYFFSVYRSLQ